MGFFSRFTGKSEDRPSAASGPGAAKPVATGPGATAGRQPDAAPASGVPLPAACDVCIPTLSLAPGMRLAQPVRRADGVVLLPAGSELDADQVRHLIQRGVEFVHVMHKETRDAAQIERDVAAATCAPTAGPPQGGRSQATAPRRGEPSSPPPGRGLGGG
jgi:hypothetical protein